MKLTDCEKEKLLEMGIPKEDFWQIGEAMNARNTTYTYCRNGVEKRISREKAYELLGMRKYLSGMARSAFHWDASRTVVDTDGTEIGVVYFDSSNFFRQK